MNGVDPARQNAAPSVHPVSEVLENPNATDVGHLEDRTADQSLLTQPFRLPQPTTAEPPYHELPHQGANVISSNRDRAVMEAPNVVTPTSSAMRVQEFYTTRSGSAGEPQGVRWMARFTEFLRMTASRSANGVDRVLDGLGIPTTSQHRDHRPLETAVTNIPLNFSPPEALPSPPATTQVPAVPGSWATPPAIEGPLFGPAELARMNQAQRDYPMIYGRPQGQGSDDNSERSSRLQAEVQRQLEEYKVKQQQEVERLQREILQLRGERDEERKRNRTTSAMGTMEQGHLPQSSSVPEGNQGLLPQPPTVPKGPGVPGAIPQRELHPPPIPHQGLLHQSHGVLGGSQDPLYQGHAVLGGSQNPLYQGHGVLGGSQNPLHQGHGVLGGCQTPLHQGYGVSGGSQGLLPQSSSVPGGNQVPQPPGPKNNAQAGGLPGPSLYAAQAGGLPGPSTKSAQAGGLPGVQSTAQQWLGQKGQEGTIAMLADGMAQLQAALIDQIGKKGEGDRSPETIKPGTQALPLLKEVCADTSCVDVMDWLEVIHGPMSDLSDSSASWWTKVTTEANRAWQVHLTVLRCHLTPRASKMEDLRGLTAELRQWWSQPYTTP